ncbi:sensor domain-containing diguanylate cyclase [Paenibacillus radicis (ex Xue et al. 2023)]|uniref:GGDEF domain-containing protein n=1 Tax=Paenibacillus radicis (ex Xue et al. 2023) TaxID=2972489 RepID=A0ABT1YUB4_9BACL|nr:sensor domain-containing diguanylate cyclase [Paenibacillus radicis (ex Xue et al. 2023)]MCR8635953.1 GGDEF domain-containing protein [Paenibacillus radicis (ex Xue et al. 2023)]
MSQQPNDLIQVEALIKRPEMLSYILGQLSNRMYILDMDGTIAYTVLTQQSLLELVLISEPVTLFTCIHPDNQLIVKESLDELLTNNDKVSFECQWAVNNEEWSWIEAVIIPVKEADSTVHKYLLSIRSISEMKEREEQLSRLAYLDPLTELPNRRAFELHLQQAIANAKRYNQLMALFYTDIDDFKWINDRYGHETGDLLLKAFASKVKRCIREIDMLSRLGGDEFVILLPRIDTVTSVQRVAERVVSSVREGWRIGEQVLEATISMGVAVYPSDGDDAVKLLQNVDKALYQVKNNGRNGISYYTQN